MHEIAKINFLLQATSASPYFVQEAKQQRVNTNFNIRSNRTRTLVQRTAYA